MKTASGGIRTIPPRRRASNASSDSSSFSSKLANYPHYSETILSCGNGTQPMRQISSTSTPNGSRKRVNPSNTINNTNSNQIGVKRSKISKKTSNHNQNGCSPNTNRLLSVTSSPSSSLGSTSKRQVNSDNEETETIEKRNLHNDMERQRRIGLKNLFENLKDKIPSLQEKDRAPKVNILREATLLCNKLTRDDMEIESLKRRQQRLMQRLKQLKASMGTMRGGSHA